LAIKTIHKLKYTARKSFNNILLFLELNKTKKERSPETQGGFDGRRARKQSRVLSPVYS
jgi:hypothetical protein